MLQVKRRGGERTFLLIEGISLIHVSVLFLGDVPANTELLINIEAPQAVRIHREENLSNEAIFQHEFSLKKRKNHTHEMGVVQIKRQSGERTYLLLEGLSPIYIAAMPLGNVTSDSALLLSIHAPLLVRVIGEEQFSNAERVRYESMIKVDSAFNYKYLNQRSRKNA